MSGLNSLHARRAGSSRRVGRTSGAANSLAATPTGVEKAAPAPAPTSESKLLEPEQTVDRGGGTDTTTQTPNPDCGDRGRTTVPFPLDQIRTPASLPSALKPKDDAHSVERALLDDMLGPAGGGRSSASKPAAASGASAPGGGDSSLITAMAGRLAKLEAAQRMYRDEMVKKEREVMTLKRELQALQSSSSDSKAAASEIVELRRQNDVLRGQIHEMETFLNDYGLVWVGSSPDSGAAAAAAAAAAAEGAGDGTSSAPQSSTAAVESGAAGSAASATATATAAAGSPIPDTFTRLEYGMLEEKVRMLNSMAGEGKAKIVAQGGAHQLRMPEGIPLTVFRNGFMLRRGPFRPYTDAANQAFIRDILDGYFPYEFKEGYPDGVIFDLRDRTEEVYDKDTFQAFSGKGQAVGGASKPRTLADIGDPHLPMSSKEFLDALPQSVIRNGNVIEVRSGIAERLRGAAAAERPDVVVVDTPALRAIQGVDGRPMTPHDVATIQVKSDTGKQTLIIKLRYDDTVGDLRTFIDSHRATGGDYDIRTAFPNRAYTDSSKTIREEGLIPNATVMIRPQA